MFIREPAQPSTVKSVIDIDNMSPKDRMMYLVNHYYRGDYVRMAYNSDEISLRLIRSFYNAADVYEAVGTVPGNSHFLYAFLHTIEQAYHHEHQYARQNYQVSPLIRILTPFYNINLESVKEELNNLLKKNPLNEHIRACADSVYLTITLLDTSIPIDLRQEAFKKFSSDVYVNISFLPNFDFSNRDLSQYNFIGTSVSGGNFQQCTFKNLTDTNFSSSDMRKANFSNLSIKDCRFINANVSGADFSEAAIRSSNIHGMNATDANFQDAFLMDMFSKDNFTDTIFDGANLSGVTWLTLNDLRFGSNMIEEDLQNIFNIISLSKSSYVIAISIVENIKLIIRDLIKDNRYEDALLLADNALNSALINLIKQQPHISGSPTLFKNQNSIIDDMLAIKNEIIGATRVSVKERSMMFRQ